MKSIEINELKVMLGIVSPGTWHSQYGLSLVSMVTHFMQTKVPGYTHQSILPKHVEGSLLPNMRFEIIEEALARRATHVLFIDVDQSFPKDIVHKWVAHKVDVVAANVATKRIPAQPTARAKPKQGEPGFGIPIYTSFESKGLEQVWRIGTGLMMLRTNVLTKLEPGYLAMPWKPDVKKYQGEDWSMAEAIERAGFNMWIDHDMSKRIGHWGKFNYTHDVVGEVQDEQSEQRMLAQQREVA